TPLQHYVSFEHFSYSKPTFEKIYSKPYASILARQAHSKATFLSQLSVYLLITYSSTAKIGVLFRRKYLFTYFI
ncbi:hypothetical protein, partial [Phascolarctobacterium succinatutens]|uniref:hypothetical protein n=1 Tax=Phascolarctobacterium succinatutens TaxID=626940 RepID=UPI004025BC8E